MKLTTRQLMEMVREVIREQTAKGDGLNTAVAPPAGLEESQSQRKKEQAEANLAKFISKLQAAMTSGVWNGIGEDDTILVLRSIRTLKGAAAQANRSPESKAASANKGLVTKRKNADALSDFARAFRSQRAAEEEGLRRRLDNGLLPLYALGYDGTPSQKYYDAAAAKCLDLMVLVFQCTDLGPNFLTQKLTT